MPDIHNTTDKPDVNNTTDRPDVHNTTDKPDVHNTTDKPDVHNTTDRPDVHNTTDRPDVNNTTDRPDINNTTDKPDNKADAWNPGLSSTIPVALESQITLFRDENSHITYRDAKELSDFCGIPINDLVYFRVERLIVHELLIRVTSDLSVPDGPNYEDLGINLRDMVATICNGYALPKIADIRNTIEKDTNLAKRIIEDQVHVTLFGYKAKTVKEHATTDEYQTNTNQPANIPLSATPLTMKKQVEKTGLFSGIKSWFGYKRKAAQTEPVLSLNERGSYALNRWRQTQLDKSVLLSVETKLALDALIKTVDAIVAHRGSLLNDPALISSIAGNIAANEIAQNRLVELMDPLFHEAVQREGFRLLPIQAKPVVMNVKGASASGKSTIRPQQQQLAIKLGIPWEDFALISPDYWRKYLLDYDSLGEDYKYAAMLTGAELAIIDKKLDRYMAAKASKKQIPHLLIDRFRFDSFDIENGQSQDSKLLSRFGDQIYMFFMITPPAETVVRAWERGQTTGRYKAVDDLLFHNIEAYTGMPALFLSWALLNEKHIHFEFLNNDVPKGSLPKTAAFGTNDSITILDIQSMLDIDRFRCVDIQAKRAEDVFMNNVDCQHNSDNQKHKIPQKHKTPSEFSFLHRCVSTITNVKFVQADTGQIYAHFCEGELIYSDDSVIADLPNGFVIANIAEALSQSPWGRKQSSAESHIKSALKFDKAYDAISKKIDLRSEKQLTIGR